MSIKPSDVFYEKYKDFLTPEKILEGLHHLADLCGMDRDEFVKASVALGKKIEEDERQG